jgi:hypothetical protein
MYTLSSDKKLAVISALVEGNSIRSINRMTDVDRNTIASLLLRTGDRCAEIMDGSMRNLRCQYVQADEIWCYVGKKDKRIRKGDSPELGSQWVFVAMDAEMAILTLNASAHRISNDRI